jgi:tRNA G18 (ribose-2'-O)-methylase SpoU
VRDPIRIGNPEDPRIAEFKAIRDRDLTRGEGRFIAEGTVVLRMLARAHTASRDFVAEKVLLLENRVSGVSDILANLPPEVPVYVASAQVLDQIAGFHLHRGVLALGRRIATTTHAELLGKLPVDALVVSAFGISNHDNIGSIFRNAAAFGADAVLLDDACCDPLYRKALRVSVGTVLSVPYVRAGSMVEILSALDQAGFAVWGLSPGGQLEVGQIPASRRMALITGTEGEGLPASILSRVRTARIAQAPGLDSLNAATATGIALYTISMIQGRLARF